ncbi:hypothetical protein SARC_15406, partial [Sphaeroforma arctica JP610]
MCYGLLYSFSSLSYGERFYSHTAICSPDWTFVVQAKRRCFADGTLYLWARYRHFNCMHFGRSILALPPDTPMIRMQAKKQSHTYCDTNLPADLAGAPYQRICTNAIRREDDIWIVSSPGGPNSSA